MNAEQLCLRLLAKKDRAALERMVLAAQRALAALDVLEGRAPVALESAAPHHVPSSTASEKARKAANARWGKDAPSIAQASIEHAPSMAPSNAPSASGALLQACSEHAPSIASRASFSDSDRKISSDNSENPEENTAHAGASTPADMLRRMLKADYEGVLDGWRDGVAAAKGAYPTSLQWRDRNVLVECIVAHALDVTDRRAWLAANAEAFARSPFSAFGGVTPKRFAVWLDSGRPTDAAAPARRTPRVQGGPLAAPLGTSARSFFDDDTPSDPEPHATGAT